MDSTSTDQEGARHGGPPSRFQPGKQWRRRRDAADEADGPSREQLWALLARVGILALFVAMLLVFSVLKPDNFPTYTNAKAILEQAAVLAVLGAGLTIVLVINEFDLSFDATSSLGGALAVIVAIETGLGTGPSVLIAIVAGLVVGCANGAIVAYGRAPAFIGTLAIASVAVGVRSWITGDATKFGVPDSYISITSGSVLGIPNLILISVGCVLIAWIFLRFTVYGRHAYAVGANQIAADSAGIRTKRVRFAAFAIMGAMAGLAGVLISSQAGGSSNDSGIGLLLPTYTAAFLGASALGRRQFNVLATYFGVVFIGTLATGLSMLQQPSWTANLITGLVLVSAVLVARRQ